MCVTASAPDMRITSTRDGGALALTVTGRQYLVPTLRLPVDATTAAVEEGLKVSPDLVDGDSRHWSVWSDA